MKIVKNIKNESSNIDKELEYFLKRSGPITQKQLNDFFGYNIATDSKNIIKTKLKNWKDKKFNIDFKGIEFFAFKNHSGQKILHNLLLIETYNLLKTKLGGNVYNTFFDGEMSFPLNNSNFEYGNIFLQPDIVILRGHNIYCIEMDMGTESYDILKEKEFAYKKFAKNHSLYNINIYFSSYKKRNDKMKEYGYFKGLNIEYIDIDSKIHFKNKKGEILI